MKKALLTCWWLRSWALMPDNYARQLRRWREAARRDGEKAFPGQGNALDKELMLLKRKLAKVEQERDFLKDAAAYFARESK
jgi:transposase